ncbi:MAG: hypothetical protein RI920_520, partial [Pseudomonadota bacterium]
MNDIVQAPWRVVVVEDNHATRSYLEACIKDQPQLILSASFSTLAPAQAWFDAHEADLLLVDLGLPDGSGLSLLRQVRRQCPGCDMLVVSMFGDEENVVASIEAGAVGYVHKDDDAADIAETLKAVKQGASPISPMIARHLLRRMQPLRAAGQAVPSDAAITSPAALAEAAAKAGAQAAQMADLAEVESAPVLSRR